MILPLPLLTALETALGHITLTTSVGGGDISQAVRLNLADGRRALVKWRDNNLPGLFTAEQRGLEWLHSAGALRVPEVLACSEATPDHPAFIAMDWLDTGPKTAASAEKLGQGLAALHRITGSAFGMEHDNFIGANPQSNRPTDNWVDFFREQRLGYQMELAGQNGRLPQRRAQRLEKLLLRLGDWLPPQPPASLLHGDLWGGNWLALASGEAALIDPAVYYGHREADLAFTELFGGFPSTFYAAYQTAWPLENGYHERKDLYNLYHLLNHLNLFGESYGSGVDAMLQHYAGFK